MKNITDQILGQAIDAIPDTTFDTHRVIRQIMTSASREYADDLHGQQGDDPILSLHAAIGKRLLQIPAVSATRKVTSMNVRGQENENQEWVKV